jgi:hypothetical protein
MCISDAEQLFLFKLTSYILWRNIQVDQEPLSAVPDFSFDLSVDISGHFNATSVLLNLQIIYFTFMLSSQLSSLQTFFAGDLVG